MKKTRRNNDVHHRTMRKKNRKTTNKHKRRGDPIELYASTSGCMSSEIHTYYNNARANPDGSRLEGKQTRIEPDLAKVTLDSRGST